MKIAIIGAGVIGGALLKWLKSNTNHEIFIYDPLLNKFDDLSECKAAFISVPVNVKKFTQDISIVEESINRLDKKTKVFIRSTVLPGTCDELSKKYNMSINSMPEFLTERSANTDFEKNNIIYLGYSEIESHVPDLLKLTKNIFENKKQIILKKSKETEMGKFMHNLFGAFKVTYFNVFKHICDEKNIDFECAKALIFSTGFINEEHTRAPGPDGKMGFGGKCFPVNLEAFIGYVDNDPSHMFFKDILCLNRWFRGYKEIKPKS